MTELLANVAGITLFVLIIAASIGLHEFGHYATAKRFGAKVTEFMVGFGPTLFARHRGETSFGVKAIPLGGYVRIVGMYPPGREAGGGRFGALIDQARADSLAEVGPGDEDRVFYKLPIHQRMIVMMAGPVMNLLIAAVLFTIVLAGIGLPVASTTIAETIACVPTAERPTGAAQDGACPGSQPAPANAAGIQAGDEVVAIQGEPVADFAELVTALAAVPAGEAAQVDLLRDGDPVTVQVPVVAAELPVLDDNGQATGETTTRSFVGVRPESGFEPLPVLEVPGFMWDMTVMSGQAMLSMPVRLWELTQTLATNGERDPEGPVSVVGVSRIGGEIAAAEEPFAAKAASFLGLAASLNLFLFLFNLLPLLPLDGGHVAAAGYEGVRRWFARVRGAVDPGPVDTARLLPVTYAVGAVLLAAGVLVIWADIVKPITLGG